jgi:HSP90 family molecular chaperone
LLRFYTSKSEEEPKSLDDYVENMGENQKAIYYLATDSLKSAKTAPFLEKLVQKDIEVCVLCEFWSGHHKLITHKGNLVGSQGCGTNCQRRFF